MSRIVHLLTAPSSGRGRAARASTTVNRTLEQSKATVIDITGPDAEASAQAARSAVAAGAERIVVAGGDGLVHLALQAVAGTTTVLGVVPVGTGNDFVRGVSGIPTDPGEATRVALGPATSVDVIAAEGDPGPDGDRRWIASVATSGFSADVNARANRLRFPRGPARYTVATALELPRLTHRDLTIEVDGQRHTHRTAVLAVGNTAWFGGGMQICPGADPTDGMLEVTVVSDVGRFELLRFFRSVYGGDHLRHPRVSTYRGRTIRLSGDDIDLWGDGEPVLSVHAAGLGVTLRVEPHALLLAGAT